jgi:predicted dehydrogenase
VPPAQLHVYRGYERVPIDLDLQPSLGMRGVVRDFIDSIERGHAPLAPGEAGCTVLEAVLGAYASAARQRTVGLPLEPTDAVYRQGLLGLTHAAGVL